MLLKLSDKGSGIVNAHSRCNLIDLGRVWLAEELDGMLHSGGGHIG